MTDDFLFSDNVLVYQPSYKRKKDKKTGCFVSIKPKKRMPDWYWLKNKEAKK